MLMSLRGRRTWWTVWMQDFSKLIWPQNICLFLPSLHEISGNLVWNILWERLILAIIWVDFRKPDGLMVKWGCCHQWSSWRPPGWGVVCVSREGSQSQVPPMAFRNKGCSLPTVNSPRRKLPLVSFSITHSSSNNYYLISTQGLNFCLHYHSWLGWGRASGRSFV